MVAFANDMIHSNLCEQARRIGLTMNKGKRNMFCCEAESVQSHLDIGVYKNFLILIYLLVFIFFMTAAS